jgi:hypothetical protein
MSRQYTAVSAVRQTFYLCLASPTYLTMPQLCFTSAMVALHQCYSCVSAMSYLWHNVTVLCQQCQRFLSYGSEVSRLSQQCQRFLSYASGVPQLFHQCHGCVSAVPNIAYLHLEWLILLIAPPQDLYN